MVKKLLINKKSKVLIVLIALIGMSYGGYAYKTKVQAISSEEPVLKEERVQKGDIIIDFTGDGEAQIPVINLDFEISGKLKELFVDTGQSIKKGDIVAKLEDTDYMNKLQNAQVQYEKAITKLEQTKQQFKLTTISEKQKLDALKSTFDEISLDYDAMIQLESIYPKMEIEKKRIAYESAKIAYETQIERLNIIANESKDIEMEKANVTTAEIALKTAQNDLDNTVLKSPMDANILTITYKPGETIPTVKESGEVTSDTSHFMVISDADKLEVIVPVSEIDLSNVFIDQEVEIEFEAFEGKKFRGKVLSIDVLPKIASSGLVTYEVKIGLDEGTNQLKTGMTCTTSFILNQRKNILTIPNKSVSIVDGKQVVQVKDEQGNIEIRTIKTGLTDGNNVEVMNGLKSGETIFVKEKK
ncbi:efflux RND transporter periplasmic adaptor subunit [Marinisporobacter balticus]|uniref:Macrolide-specific efflux system membrane fusion protein n=1 Tax=Marinisporobacter balticus TaxID=2018667 RepID=A0A4R2L0W5_9FIRM|nr:efflux RND transporter periplasmic adaptor subunit [Marinisporobacter balticus]TCO77439.1 macrolide-specific efflux system membrane fusion protein [Marinisporobacter balticus]